MKPGFRVFILSLSLSFSSYACFARVADCSVLRDSIYSLEAVRLGGVAQTILITGKNLDKPVLLVVHGGPGFSEMGLFRKYESGLDDDFIVVNWDQRGTNLSYSPDIPRGSMTMEQIVADGIELVHVLQRRFHRRKIFLLGHSWGTVVATLMARDNPDDFLAYISVSQIVNMQENERLSTDFARQMAQKDSNKAAIAELNAIMPYPSPASTFPQLYTSRKWMQFYGGQTFGAQGSGDLFAGVTDGKSPLYDVRRSEVGADFSMETLWIPLLQLDMIKLVPELKIPAYFLIGAHDFNAPHLLAEQYFERLKAPLKKMILFEHSAHFLLFEEPKKFREVVVSVSEAKN